MILDAAARAPVGLLPVVVFLAVLVYFDSYKLVSLRAVIGTILVGTAAAVRAISSTSRHSNGSISSS